MFFLQHYLKVLKKIFSSRYPYAKISLVVSYKILILRSITYHKIKLFRSRTEKKKAHFIGLTVLFFSWPHLLNLFEEIFAFQIYKFSHHNSSPLIIDCGSNVGVSILYFKKLFPQGKIIGFEPDHESFKLLEKNVNENNLQNVTLYNIAVHSTGGEMSLYRAAGNRMPNMSLISTADKPFGQTVAVNRLSGFISQPVDLLKIDVEGSEISIIDDLIMQSKMHLVQNMIIEYHPQITHVSPEAFVKKLESCGFGVSIMPNELHERASEVMMFVKKNRQ
jgi:FkbM family methyltransferase